MERKSALIYLHVAVLLFGLSGLFGKWLSIDASAIVFGRTLVAAIAVFCVLQFRGAARTPVSGGSLGLTLLSGAVLALHWGTFFYAIQVSTVAIGLVGFSAFPVFVTFVEPFLSKQALRPVDVLSAAMVTVGLVLVAPSFDLHDAGTRGLLWAVLSGALFALLTLMNRHLIKQHPVMQLALVQNAAACALALPFVWMAGAFPSLPDWGALVVLGVFCTALPHLLFVQSLSAIRAQLASVVAGLEPVYGVIFAALLLREIPALSTLVGGVVVFAAVLLAVRAHASEPH